MDNELGTPGSAFTSAVEDVRAARTTVESAASGLLDQLSDRELLSLLDGDRRFLPGFIATAIRYNSVPYVAGRIDRLGIPGIRFTDGPRGVVMGSATAFPVAIARAASWDVDLERRVGAVIGQEARALGANLFAGICLNMAPFAGWGRSQEAYGEEPHLMGAMGAAIIDGVKPWVLSTVKHFALNSMEEGRFRVDVQVDDATLNEVYLPHFKTAIDAGVDAVMSAYNSVNGEWAGESTPLLTTVLRDQLGFDGFVMTDFIWGLRHPVESVSAGQDLEMPFSQQRASTLPKAVRAGRLAKDDVRRAGARLLTAQLNLALRAEPTPPASVLASPEHRALAREVAHRSTVLLRNADVDRVPVLPMDVSGGARIAVLGSLADAPNMGDVGSSQVFPPSSVSIAAGLTERLGDRIVRPDDGSAEAAMAAASSAHTAIIVVGLSSVDEGESLVAVDVDSVRLFGGLARFRPIARLLIPLLRGAAAKKKVGGDRRDLRLHPQDVELIEAVARVNARTVVVLIGGGTIITAPWESHVASVLLAWYPGMEGGRAIADVLLGIEEPGGRLPVTIPHSQADLPAADWDASIVRYPRIWGQRALDAASTAASHPFGFGLGYTTFSIDSLRVGTIEDDGFTAQVGVTNVGTRPGRHVVQLYAAPSADGSRPRALLGFATIALAPGESATVRIPGSVHPLQQWNGRRLAFPAGPFEVEAAAFWGDPAAATASLSNRPARTVGAA
ncbi:beta-glucosidase [Microbacterium sp. W4I4]|uniref:beta-glucosidase family protein n=1 Tax=Microbacterium sp. W4I4 TaxID=3042295 RepID=UPI00277DA162|nr:glycoside hydrolase family 3 C-terminal domain-containing protein [Microbacterium sp. W4I4]MDQ0614001.1 beta-glucosidase [Microbacterium sp. W4I4]